MVTITRSSIAPSVEIIHSTFEDNSYLDEDYKKILRDLFFQDSNAYSVYTLGLWGLVQRRIFTKYKIIPELPELSGGHQAYGLDFGLVNPSAVVKVYTLGDKIYAEEKLYKSNLTNSDLIEFFSHQERGDIYGDPTSKMLIEEIRRAGYSAFEGHKGVKETIDLCQRFEIIIPQSSTNLIKEIHSYQWKQNKDGTILPEPVKYNDHGIDALRYAVWGLVERFGQATSRAFNTKPISTLRFAGIRNLGRRIRV